MYVILTEDEYNKLKSTRESFEENVNLKANVLLEKRLDELKKKYNELAVNCFGKANSAYYSSWIDQATYRRFIDGVVKIINEA